MPAAHDQTQDEIVLSLRASDHDRKEKDRGVSTLLDIYNAVNDWLISKSSIQLSEKLLFFELLSSTLHAGISVPDSLRLIGEQMKNPRLKDVIGNLVILIEDGESLAQSMRRNDDVFDEATCAIIEAGEKSGKLNEVLKELVQQFERMDMIKKKVTSVMIYPSIVISVMIVMAIVMIIVVIPKLTSIFEGIDNLPFPTRALLFLKDLFLEHGLLLLLGCILAGTVFSIWKNTRTGKRQISNLLIHTPGIGTLIKGMILARITRILGFLIASGVPIIEALKITSNVAGNPIYQEKLLLASDDMSKGIPLAENLSDNEKLFPSMLVNMIGIGEKTASLEVIMEKIATFYDDELSRKVENLSKLMEPAILIFITGGAVFMMLAVYLPISQMNDYLLG